MIIILPFLSINIYRVFLSVARGIQNTLLPASHSPPAHHIVEAGQPEDTMWIPQWISNGTSVWRGIAPSEPGIRIVTMCYFPGYTKVYLTVTKYFMMDKISSQKRAFMNKCKNFQQKLQTNFWPNFICIFYSMHIILHKNFTCLKKLFLESLQTRHNYYCGTYIFPFQVHGYSLLYPPNPSSLPWFTGGLRRGEPHGTWGPGAGRVPLVSWREQCDQGDQEFVLFPTSQ